MAAAAAATTTDYTVEHYSPAATTQDKTVYKSNQDLEIRIEAFEKDGDETWFPYRRHFYGQGKQPSEEAGFGLISGLPAEMMHGS